MTMATRDMRPLLAAGAVSAPVLLLVIGIDGATRTGYDAWHHGVSQLVLGDRGWLERLTYLLCGLFIVAFAVGTNRALPSGPGSTWGPRLIAAVGAGLVVAGVFPTDPALGYPVGEPATVTVAGRLHQVGGSLLFIGLVGACFALARRFARERRQVWRVYSLATGVLVAGSALAAGIVYRLETAGVMSGGPVGGLERIAFLFGFGWIMLLACQMLRNHRTQRVRQVQEEGTDRT